MTLLDFNCLVCRFLPLKKLFRFLVVWNHHILQGKVAKNFLNSLESNLWPQYVSAQICTNSNHCSHFEPYLFDAKKRWDSFIKHANAQRDEKYLKYEVFFKSIYYLHHQQLATIEKKWNEIHSIYSSKICQIFLSSSLLLSPSL
jgi:3-methyladenine DNA glycosylase/8-oxoguanine DNA glycosylase